MTSAHELPADDPTAFTEAVTRAAAGEHVRLVAADGRRVADVVPPTNVAFDVSDDERAARSTKAFLAATGGTVTPEAARRVYASLGRPYPGDDEISRRYPERPAS